MGRKESNLTNPSKLFDTDIGFNRIVCFVMEKKNDLFHFNTYSRISLCARGHNFMYVEGKHQGHRIAFSDFKNFALLRENNDFAEFMVQFIHRKRVPLLHNTVLFYAMKEMGWWPCKLKLNGYKMEDLNWGEPVCMWYVIWHFLIILICLSSYSNSVTDFTKYVVLYSENKIAWDKPVLASRL